MQSDNPGMAGDGLFRALIENSSEAIAILDDSLAVIYESTSLPRVSGYPINQWIGKDVSQMAIHPQDLAMLLDQLAAFKSRPGAVVRDIAVRYRDPGGSWRWIEATGHNLLHDPNVRGIVINYRDITDRKRYEAALRESEEKFSRVFYGSPNALAISRLEDGRFIDVNDAFLKMTGYDRDEIIGRDAAAIGMVVDEGYRQRLLQVIAGPAGYERMDLPLRTRDGGIKDVLTSAERVSVNGVDCLVSTFVDITKRKQRERRIASLTRLYAMLSRTNEAIVRTADAPSLYPEICRIVAEEGDFPLAWIGQVAGTQVIPVAWSGPAAGYLQETSVELWGGLGMGPTGTCLREDRAVVNNDFEANPLVSPWRDSVTKYGFRSSGAFPLRRGGRAFGALTLYSLEANAFDEDQVRLLESLSSDVSYAIDATDRENRRLEAEEQLRRRTADLQLANQQLESFAYTVSHDLRAPLRRMTGFSEALVEECADRLDETGKDYVSRIRKAGQSMGELIDGILELSRVVRAEFHWQMVDLSGLCQEIAQALQAAEPKRTVEFAIAPGLVARGDSTLLRAALTNLLDNAWKFSSRQAAARIEIGETVAGGVKSYYVRDNGIGFDVKNAARLFEPFQRFHARKGFGGTGIGLATTKRIINRHGGRLWAESQPGQGTTFYFTIADSPTRP